MKGTETKHHGSMGNMPKRSGTEMHGSMGKLPKSSNQKVNPTAPAGGKAVSLAGGKKGSVKMPKTRSASFGK